MAKDDLPGGNINDSELLLDAQVMDKLQVIEGEKNQTLGEFTVTSKYTLQEIDAIEQNIYEKYRDKLNKTLKKDIDEYQKIQNKKYYQIQ